MVTLDHVTLRTAALDATRDFFVDVIGLCVGDRPDFGFPGYWLYADDNPLVHLVPGPGRELGRQGETIDHAGFRVTDLEPIRQRLIARDWPYAEQTLTTLAEDRLFTKTPTGILIELVARHTDA